MIKSMGLRIIRWLTAPSITIINVMICLILSHFIMMGYYSSVILIGILVVAEIFLTKNRPDHWSVIKDESYTTAIGVIAISTMTTYAQINVILSSVLIMVAYMTFRFFSLFVTHSLSEHIE